MIRSIPLRLLAGGVGAFVLIGLPLLLKWPFELWMLFVAIVATLQLPNIISLYQDPSRNISLFAVRICLSVPLFGLGWAIARSYGVVPYFAVAVGIMSAYVFLRVAFYSTHLVRAERPWTQNELSILLATLLFNAIVVVVPFSSYLADHGSAVGIPYLVVTDVLHHVSVVAELAHRVPPENPYFNGSTLHYYWLAHSLPASLQHLTSNKAPAHFALQMAMSFYSVSLTFLLHSFIRIVFKDWRIQGCLLILAFSCFAFVWLLPLAQSALHFLALLFPGMGIGVLAFEQGESYSGLSHGFLRDFVTEPQGTLSFAILLSLLLWRRISIGGKERIENSFAEGLILGCCFGVDGFLGVIGTIWWGVLKFSDYIEFKVPFLRMVQLVAAMSIGLLFVHLVLFALGVHGKGDSGNVTFSPYWRMLLMFPVVLILEFGASAILALFGFRALLQKKRENKDILLLFGVTVPLMFSLQHTFVHNLVFRKSLRLIRLVLLILAGEAIGGLLKAPPRQAIRVVVMTLIALGLPALFTDLRALSQADGSGRSELLAKNDYDASIWIRTHVPLGAVLQSRPDYGRASNFTPIIAFGERQSALGDFIRARNYQIGEKGPTIRAGILRDVIFGGIDPDEAVRASRQLGITHLYVGDVERRYYGENVNKFVLNPDLFTSIYDRDGIHIFQIR